MRTDDLERLLGAPLGPVRGPLGEGSLDVRALSPLRPTGAGRTAFRVATSDGRTFKVRRALSPRAAETAERLLAEVADPRFSRILLRHGAVLLEEWVAGSPLPESGGEEDLVDEAGDLLGSLHARVTSSGAALHARLPTAPVLAQTDSYLDELRAAGGVEGVVAARLREAAVASDPVVATVGVCHDDFCAENMIVDAGGRLRVVDNERVGIGPLDGDLERTFYRWPMSAPRRDRFLAAYARRRDPGEALANAFFWRLVTVVRSAHVRVVRLRACGATPLAELDRLVARADAGETSSSGRRPPPHARAAP